MPATGREAGHYNDMGTIFTRAPRDTGNPPPPNESALLMNRSCCCPARPAVLVIMPPAITRPHETDLFLCDHHFRLSREALSAARASVQRLRD
jgi:hypothetical protein